MQRSIAATDRQDPAADPFKKQKIRSRKQRQLSVRNKVRPEKNAFSLPDTTFLTGRQSLALSLGCTPAFTTVRTSGE